MELELTGLHHITAITAHAPENLAFYTQVLGLRLVKKTVNQDDVSAYHLFYADAHGSAGTEVTFFDWSMAAANQPGAGEVSSVGLRVPGAKALEWWAERFESLGVPHRWVEDATGNRVIAFVDPEGQRLQLVDDSGASIPGGTPWDGSKVPVEVAIRGLGTVTLTVRRVDGTARVLTELLGFRQTGEFPLAELDSGRLVRFETGKGGVGGTVLVEVRPDLPHARQGRGGVHHIAYRTPTFEAHEAWQTAPGGVRRARYTRDRPLLFPFNLFPRTGWRPLRDCHRWTWLRHRRRRSASGRESGTATVPGTVPPADRSRTQAA